MNPAVSNTRLFTTTGNKNYELSNHLGNVLALITDKKIPRNTENTPFFETQITSVSDFYPFGSLLEGRHESSKAYRYGFQGHENDNEVKGTGNHLDFGARCYDSRLGKFLSLDPMSREYPSVTDYSCCLNPPIMFVDPTGEIVTFANKRAERYYNRISKAAVHNDNLKTRLDKLESSDVEYRIKVNKLRNGGVTKYNFKKDRLELNIKDIGDYTFAILGDELTNAEQFEDGDLGYALDNSGTVIPIGYDLEDEITSKIGSNEAIDAINKEENLNIKGSEITKYPSSSKLSELLEDNNNVLTDQQKTEWLENNNYNDHFKGENRKPNVHIKGNDEIIINKSSTKDYIYRKNNMTIQKSKPSSSGSKSKNPRFL